MVESAALVPTLETPYTPRFYLYHSEVDEILIFKLYTLKVSED